MSDKEEQINELEALQSIFDNELTLLNEESTNFEIEIEIEIPFEQGITLRTHLPVNGEDEEEEEEEEGEEKRREQRTVDFNFKYLPAIILEVQFPENYPSERAADFKIKSTWLNNKQLGILCNKLDEIWKEVEGTPVVYYWFNELKNALEILEITEENSSYELHSIDDPVVDRRGVQEFKNSQSNLMKLLEFNRVLLERDFKNSNHDCPLCFDHFSGYDFITLNCCGSYYCVECLKEMTKLNIKEGSVQKVRCPKCSQALHPTVIKQITTDEEYDRWDTLTFKKAVEGMDDTEYCPKCEALVITDDMVGQCPNCEYVFCAKCLDRYPCNVNGSNCENFLDSSVRKSSNNRETDEMLKTIQWMKSNGVTKRCPGCKMFVEKIAGCNKMSCFNCGNIFCYVCGFLIRGYDHFGSSRCPLFTTNPANQTPLPNQAQIVRRAPVIEIRVEDGEVFEFPVALKQKACPSCGQKSYKHNKNNDITCWACGRHFCFTCNIAIKGTKHFTPTGCRQHTDDV